jgi:hypothetical protein
MQRDTALIFKSLTEVLIDRIEDHDDVPPAGVARGALGQNETAWASEKSDSKTRD